MAEPAGRRPLPAVAFLIGPLLLTALVWYRVIHRSDRPSHVASPTSCPTAPSAVPGALPAPSAVSVLVLNSTQRAGLAAGVAQTLTQDGFKSAGAPTNDKKTPPVAGVAEIRSGPAGKAGATLLSYYVPGATLVTDQRTDASVDVALGATFTALAPPATVVKALAAAKLTVSPTKAPTAASTRASGTC